MENNVDVTVSEEMENLTTVENDLLDTENEAAPEETGSALVAGVMQEKNMQQVSTKQRVMKILVQIGLY